MKKRGFAPYIFYGIIILGLFLFLNNSGAGLFGGFKSEKVNYTVLVNAINKGKVESLAIENGKNETSYVEAILKSGDDDKRMYTTYAPIDDLKDVIRQYETKHPGKLEVEYAILSEDGWSTALMLIATFAVIGFVVFFFISQQGSGGGKVMNFGKSKAKMYMRSDKEVSFKDVAGADEEKEELAEVVDFLKHPDRYMKLGAKIPKGVLLVGPPGTGKTLLARATAGEAGVPFFTISGSDFVEMFVGVGASRVRDLFESAKKNSPCIVFIDEIDAVGRHRGAGLGGGNDEREQTLNQLLVEMDGFSEHQGIIILAATNRADILDPALLRPGRFDRQILVNVPDVKGREEILAVHAKNKPLAENINLKTLAKATPGFTGADLANVMNEASLLSARAKKKQIGMSELEEAIKRTMAGPQKKSKLITEDDKKLTSYHEAGHAVVSYYTPGSDPVHEITIIPRGQSGGWTMYLPDNDNQYTSKKSLLSHIVTCMGGRVAEELMLDDISAGAVGDIQQATSVARKMIMSLGMSELGPICYDEGDNDVFIGRDFMRSKQYSEETAAKIDKETNRLISEGYEKAKEIISTHRDKVELVAKALMEHETLNGEEFRSIMKNGLIDESLFDKEYSLLEDIEENSGNTDKKED